MKRAIALLTLAFSMLQYGCASARIGSVHLADRGVLVTDPNSPIVAVVTDRGVQKLAGNSIVRMNPASRWAVVAESQTGPRWVPWKTENPQGPGMILTLPDRIFTAIDLDTGQLVAVGHGFN